jgi:hypothetical protein
MSTFWKFHEKLQPRFITEKAAA